MSILNKLASALGHRDEVPNQQLAEEIVKRNDAAAVKELIANLKNKSKDIQNDCIKVLYEIGERKPSLITSYLNEFLSLLDSKNNRLQWGGMTAINTIALQNAKAVYEALPKIIDAANKGSVITRDHAVYILVKLCTTKYADDVFPFLVEQLKNCPTNQLPMYAENTMPIVTGKNKNIFINTLTSRLSGIEKETAKKRVEKVIKKLS